MRHKMRYRKCFTKAIAMLLSAALLFSAVGFPTMAEASGVEDIPGRSYVEEQNVDFSNLSTLSNASSEENGPEQDGDPTNTLDSRNSNPSVTPDGGKPEPDGEPIGDAGGENMTDSDELAGDPTENAGNPNNIENGSLDPDATPPNAAPISQTAVIAGFAQLDEAVMNQKVEIGATMETINLPEELEAYDVEEQSCSILVNWGSEDFNGEIAGTYIFTSVLQEEYELAEGASLPAIEVTVHEAVASAAYKADTVAVINGTEYTSLADAINNVQPGTSATIQIVSNTTITEQINVERKKIILTADETHTITFANLGSNENCFRVGNWSDTVASLTISGQLTITTTNDSLRSIVNVVKSAFLSLQGGTLSSGDAVLSKSIVCIDNGGSMTMSGGVIQGSQEHNSCGVMLQDTSDPSIPMSFTMTGGTIIGCRSTGRGGGVWVLGSAEFTMTNGTISNCSGQDGGGVAVTGTGKFTMNGGTIMDCSATGRGGGVAIFDTAAFTMNSGTIKSCSSGSGNYVYQGQGTTFDRSDGTIEDIDREIVAKIDGEEYFSLQEAINTVAQNQGEATTIQIVNNTTITEQVSIEKRNIELTAAGKYTITFSLKTDGGNCFRLSGVGSLTINSENLTVTTANEKIRTLVSVPSGCLFSLKAGTLSSGNAEIAKAIVCVDNGGSVTMSGGIIQGDGKKTAAA